MIGAKATADHKCQDQIKFEELRESVLVADRRVDKNQEHHGHKEHNWDLSKHLRCSVNPNVVHVGGTLTHKDGLLTLEDDDSRQEIQKHLHDAKEVSCSNHAVKLLSIRSIALSIGVGAFDKTIAVLVFVQLPEGRHKEERHN